MKRWLLAAALVMISTAAFAQSSISTEYKTMTGQLFLRQTAGGSALFKVDGVDYDVWLPNNRELATIVSGSTVTIEGVFTADRQNPLAAPVLHPYKITYKGRVTDLTTSFGWDGKGTAADVVTGASTSRPSAPGTAGTGRNWGSRDGRKGSREGNREEEREDDD